MTLVADIIEEAFREASLISELQHPTPTQNARALTRLQSIVAAAYDYEIGEPLTDWPLERMSNGWIYCRDYPLVNSRIIVNATKPETLYLPLFPLNGTRIKVIDTGNNLATYNLTLNTRGGQLIEGATSLVLNTNGLNRTWIYDADTANWVRMTDLDGLSEMPTPIEFDDYFITSLAIALSPRYNAAISDSTVKRLSESKSKLRARYRQSKQMHSELALLKLPSDNRWGRFWGYSFPGAFERGWTW